MKTNDYYFQLGFSGGGGAVILNHKLKKMLSSLISLPKLENYVSHMTQMVINESLNYFQANNGQFFGQFVGKFISVLSAVRDE